MKHNDNSGDWQKLADPAQTPRYEAIAALIPPGATVLDLGCGTAILRTFLPSQYYLGVEPSALACKEATRRAAVYNDTAETFTPNAKFDRIVCSEFLYYCDDPLAMLTRYAEFLEPQGRIIITIYQKQGQRPGLRKWLRKLRHPRHPLTNLACLRAVEAFLASDGWTVYVRTEVARPGSTETWALLEVSP